MIGAMIAKARAKRQFEARGRGDLDTFLAGWADDATFEFPGSEHSGGVFRGKPQIRDWYERFQERFPNARFELERIFVSNLWAMTADNEVAVEWRAKLSEDLSLKGVVVVMVRRGKAVHVKEYFFRPPTGANE